VVAWVAHVTILRRKASRHSSSVARPTEVHARINIPTQVSTICLILPHPPPCNDDKTIIHRPVLNFRVDYKSNCCLTLHTHSIPVKYLSCRTLLTGSLDHDRHVDVCFSCSSDLGCRSAGQPYYARGASVRVRYSDITF
jgi:hypothetical protein